MEKICILTLGCKVNQYESDALVYQFKSFGFDVSTELSPASIYIINSCAVTNEAEHKSREQISKITKLSPNAKIYVCGCSSELHPDSFLDKPNVVAVMGTENKLKLFDIIKKNLTGNQKLPQSSTYFDGYSSEPTRTRAYIKIQDGCNNFCSYCIIPYTRGRERSRTIESIAKELERLSTRTKEIVLVGINIASYGKDLTPKRSLTDVVKLFKKYPDLRLRFSSFEMGTITKKLLAELKKLPNFCPFFHISLQSANNDVLKKMNRHHTFEDYLNTVTNIRSFFPNAGISTDIIAGFPTESDENFLNGIDNIKKINFSNIHIFPYSKREGTVASTYKQINGCIVKKRAKILSEIATESKTQFIQHNLNLEAEVLVEEFKKGFFTGFTKNYLKTYIPPTFKLELNRIYKIKIIAPYLDGVMGELAEV